MNQWRGMIAAWAISLAFAAHTAQAQVKVSGYTQVRYNFFDRSMYLDDDFDLRQVRIKLTAPVNQRGTVATIQVDMAGLDNAASRDVRLKDARIDQPMDGLWHARVGFASMLFGYEVPQSSAARLPFGRSRPADRLFPGQRDTGVYFIREPAARSQPQVVVAYSDGMDLWPDDDKEAAVARLQWSLPNNSLAGISYMDASRTQDGDDFSQDVFGVHARWNPRSGVSFQAEYYDGKLLSDDVDGWYAQVEHAFPESRWTAYYRYDTFDDGDSTPDDFARSTLGVAYQLDEKQRLSFEVDDRESELGVSATNYGAQWQFKY